MRHRKLGRTGFDVSELGYGAWGISGKQWIGSSTNDALAALRAATEGGVDFIDTALAYGDGVSERLVGQVVRETGGRVRVATKVPPKNRLWPAQPGIGIEDVFPYDYIIASAEESLINLNLESIDLFQLHVWNPDWVDRDEWRRAFETLKKSGKVRAVGVSINDHQPDSGIGIVETGLIDSVQVIYNIFDQTPEAKLFPACVKHNIGVIARVPFDEGSLAGRVTPTTVFPEGDFRNHYFRGERKQQVATRVGAILNDLKLAGPEALPAVALRFCLSSPAVSTVIPGMRSLSSVSANLTAAGQGPLPTDLLDILRGHRWDRNFYD
jgi:aryl-alcohol dehydrogenase-like predicted oxidoreductase